MKRMIAILVLCVACAEQPKQHKDSSPIEMTSTMQSVKIQEKPFTRIEADSFIDPNKFKVSRQDSFSLKNWYYGARQEKLIKLTAKEIIKYFQKSEVKSQPANGEQSVYFFSVQENNKQRKVITLIEEYDFCCADLMLMTYNQDNELIGKSKVAGTGGDGGWGYNEYGHFITDSVYQLFKVEETTLRDDQDTMEYRIDSLVTRFKVNKGLNFEKSNENKFQRNKIISN